MMIMIMVIIILMIISLKRLQKNYAVVWLSWMDNHNDHKVNDLIMIMITIDNDYHCKLS